MLNRANATRCSLVFAVLTMLSMLVMSLDIAAKPLRPSACRLQLEGGSSSVCAQSDSGATESQPLKPVAVAYKYSNDDLVATNRRSNGTRVLISDNCQLRDGIALRSNRPDCCVVTHRDLDERKRSLVEFESFLSPAHETRGEPSSGHWLS
jgi:hypothetical protein